MKKITFIALIAIIIDRIFKIIALNIKDGIVIIKDFFKINVCYNYGAAWSSFNGLRWFLILISILAMVLIYIYFIKNKKSDNIDIIVFGFLYGGIIGNLIDRIIYGYVIDFLDFIIFRYDFPVFNIADSFIVISMMILIYKTFWRDEHGSR